MGRDLEPCHRQQRRADYTTVQGTAKGLLARRMRAREGRQLEVCLHAARGAHPFHRGTKARPKNGAANLLNYLKRYEAYSNHSYRRHRVG